MDSRERVWLALDHQEADRGPRDLGGCGQTGMHVSTVYALRQALAMFNAHPLLESLGDTITTGPTGNNLRDLRILLAY